MNVLAEPCVLGSVGSPLPAPFSVWWLLHSSADEHTTPISAPVPTLPSPLSKLLKTPSASLIRIHMIVFRAHPDKPG